MKDEKFNRYLSEHGLVAVSKEFYLVLLNDHIKIQKLKKMTEHFDQKEEKRC